MQATTLEAIGRSDCALAIWRRNAVDAVSADLAALDHDAIDDIDTVVQSSDLTVAIAARLAAAGYPARLAARLTEDIAGLGATFAGLCGQAALKLRLEWIETDACRRFHADQATVRLL